MLFEPSTLPSLFNAYTVAFPIGGREERARALRQTMGGFSRNRMRQDCATAEEDESGLKKAVARLGEI